jgi:hypothetical protein
MGVSSTSDCPRGAGYRLTPWHTFSIPLSPRMELNATAVPILTRISEDVEVSSDIRSWTWTFLNVLVKHNINSTHLAGTIAMVEALLVTLEKHASTAEMAGLLATGFGTCVSRTWFDRLFHRCVTQCDSTTVAWRLGQAAYHRTLSGSEEVRVPGFIVDALLESADPEHRVIGIKIVAASDKAPCDRISTFCHFLQSDEESDVYTVLYVMLTALPSQLCQDQDTAQLREILQTLISQSQDEYVRTTAARVHMKWGG